MAPTTTSVHVVTGAPKNGYSQGLCPCGEPSAVLLPPQLLHLSKGVSGLETSAVSKEARDMLDQKFSEENMYLVPNEAALNLVRGI